MSKLIINVELPDDGAEPIEVEATFVAKRWTWEIRQVLAVAQRDGASARSAVLGRDMTLENALVEFRDNLADGGEIDQRDQTEGSGE